VLHPVGTLRVEEVVRAVVEAGVGTDELAVLDPVTLRVVGDEQVLAAHEAVRGPGALALLRTVGEDRGAVSGDHDVVSEEALEGEAAIGGVVEAEQHRLG
jgi:hypothetical protein